MSQEAKLSLLADDTMVNLGTQKDTPILKQDDSKLQSLIYKFNAIPTKILTYRVGQVVTKQTCKNSQ